MTVILVPVLSTVTWYLLSAATLTSFIWSRYPPWLERFMICPACSGTWYGAGWSAVFYYVHGWKLFGLGAPWTIVYGSLWSMFFVPLLAWVFYRALSLFQENRHEDPT